MPVKMVFDYFFLLLSAAFARIGAFARVGVFAVVDLGALKER
jgi:hypothetical protein